VYRNGFNYEDIAIEGKGNTMPRFDASTEEGREGNTYVTLEWCIPQLAPEPEIAQVIPPKPDTLVIPDVLFRFNSSELNAKLYSSLDSLIQKIPREEAMQLQLLGHTDNVGTDEYNQDLSRRRAMSVAEYLRKKGLEQFIRHVAGMGEASPVTGNDTPEGRRKNRRVEIIIYKGAD
jgi:outer membrane protein OmpA-like peptidoglycan-associated protein